MISCSFAAEDVVLALDAHYDSSNDRFLIATGTANQDASTAVALWCAEDGRQPLSD